MVNMNSNQLRKRAFAEKLKVYLAEYKNILVCEIDFVGSNQMQQIRIALRGKAVVLVGKNTVVRKVLRDVEGGNPKLSALMPLIAGNVGFVFTNESAAGIRKVIQENKRPAPAKVGVMATNAVIVPAGPTGLDPGQTAFFQSLEIATKIMRGSIEIINDVHLVATGQKVTASHVSLLSKMGIKPFSYGMKVASVYENGFVFDAAVLDMSESQIAAKWFSGVRAVAALSLMTGFPTTASVPFSVKNAFQKCLALTFVTSIKFKESEDLMALIKSGGGGAAPAGEKQAAPAAAKKAEVVEEEEEEEDLDMGGLFGNDDEEEEEGEEEDEEEEEEEE